MVKRERRLSMLISDEEHDLLLALADREGVTASVIVRRLIRQAHAEAFGEKKTKPKK